jgi:hypothetical protein
MPYIAELAVDDFGILMAPESLLPVNAGLHNWMEIYPPVEGTLPFEWRSGARGEMPNVFWCPLIRDFVCDERSLEVISRIASSDIRVVADGVLDGRNLAAVQIVRIEAGVIDASRSLIDDFGSYKIMRFPSFRRASLSALASHLFRVPEMYPEVFFGDGIVDEFALSGLTGLRFVAADASDSFDVE